jgi:hypothetical protein
MKRVSVITVDRENSVGTHSAWDKRAKGKTGFPVRNFTIREDFQEHILFVTWGHKTLAENEQVTFMGLTIAKHAKVYCKETFRKPTFTDIIINKKSTSNFLQYKLSHVEACYM